MLKKWIGCLMLLGGLVSLCAQTESASIANDSWLSGGAQSHTIKSPPLQYPPLREADILWEKRIWRVIDTREKINLTFRHPEQSLFNVIIEGLATETLNAYNPVDDRFTERMTRQEMDEILVTRDTVTIIDPVTGDYREQVVTNEFDPERIKRWRIQEVSYFDTRYSQMKVRIIGIAPMVEESLGGGNASYETPLFWINYKEARPWLAQHAVVTTGNDYSRTSWEDLFEMRQFHSYIYQQSDMRGRRLQDYLSGEGLLIESEKIDQSIHHMEMDMWSN